MIGHVCGKISRKTETNKTTTINNSNSNNNSKLKSSFFFLLFLGGGGGGRKEAPIFFKTFQNKRSRPSELMDTVYDLALSYLANLASTGMSEQFRVNFVDLLLVLMCACVRACVCVCVCVCLFLVLADILS